MATKDLHDDGRCKTVLVYRAGEGLFLERIDRKDKKILSVPVSAEALQAMSLAWPEFQEFLSNAGVPNVGPATLSRPAYKASPEQGNSRSSPAPGALL